jgi:hypothetical protein
MNYPYFVVRGNRVTAAGTARIAVRGIKSFALRVGAAVAFFGAVGCSDECETGDLDVMLGSSRGGNVMVAETMTIRRMEVAGPEVLVELVSGNVFVATLSLQDVPSELLPDGASLYVVFTIEHREDGRIGEQVAAFDLENGVKGPLRGAIWSTLSEPELEGVTFSAKPKDCGTDGRCGKRRDTEMSARIGDGPTLRADSGYRDNKGNVELGNGFSFMHERSCSDEPTEVHHGYLFVRN